MHHKKRKSGNLSACHLVVPNRDGFNIMACKPCRMGLAAKSMRDKHIDKDQLNAPSPTNSVSACGGYSARVAQQQMQVRRQVCGPMPTSVAR